MPFWKKKSLPWPDMPFEEVKKRARILVIDDNPFAYLELFKLDGYAIDQWSDVKEITKLENGEFDIILLDVQGVGKEISPSEQGLGVLRHLRRVNPAQVIIAFSNSDFSLKYHDFFAKADAILPKSADYVEFKRNVDDLLRERFSLGFFVSRISKIPGVSSLDRVKTEREATAAIASEQPAKLKGFLLDKLVTKDNVETAVKLTMAAIEVANEWRK
jgi:DNA-binding response OmpR family regulator